MGRFLLRRALWAIPTISLLLLLTFTLTQLAPGDPVLFEIAKNEEALLQSLSDQLYDRTAANMGLDKPPFYFSIWPTNYPQALATVRPDQRAALRMIAQSAPSRQEAARSWLDYRQLEGAAKEGAKNNIGSRRKSWKTYVPSVRWWGANNQFHDWVLRAVRLDFGRSRNDGQLATSRVGSALRWTLVINLTSLFIAYMLAIPLGIYRAHYANSAFDRISGTFLNLLYAIPVFWLGTLLVVFFSTSEYGSWTNIFPSVGIWHGRANESFGQLIIRNSGQLWIPIITLSTGIMAYISQQVRSSAIEELKKTYVWQLQAKGVKSSQILWQHVFRNASFPLITMLAGLLPASISGSLVMEVICNIPGMGRLMYDSIYGQDWNIVMFIVLLSSILTVVGFFVSDILYSIADPRTRLDKL